VPGRYLVTGCAGFIGSAVAWRLLGDGAQVVGCDNLNDAYDPRLKRWRLDQLEASPGFTFQSVDVCDRAKLKTIFAGPPPDAVFHLAARAGVRASVAEPEQFVRDNVEGTLNVLEMCRAAGVQKFILASTSSLYGASADVPFSEDSDTGRPLSPYAASKQGAEALSHAYHYLHGMDVAVLRYFTVYGPAGRPDMSVFRFIRRIAEGEPITVYGDGSQRRDFTFVDDVARGTVAALSVPGYEVINLGGDHPLPLNQVIQRIGELVGRRPIIEHRDAHPADVPETWAKIDKAERLLGWRPETEIDEGLARTVAWHQENRSWLLEIGLDDEKRG
jgi:nucleoside-diphosphate-sugar epimerase